MNTLRLALATLYGTIAAIDLALCVTGLYSRHNIRPPSIANYRPGRRAFSLIVALEHGTMLWWMLDTGTFGQWSLPGYIMPWIGFDACRRMWRLLRR